MKENNDAKGTHYRATDPQALIAGKPIERNHHPH